jgi:hypothetical protein
MRTSFKTFLSRPESRAAVENRSEWELHIFAFVLAVTCSQIRVIGVDPGQAFRFLNRFLEESHLYNS